MENASKALIMAASMLIGIILLTLIVYMYGVMRDSQKERELLMSEEQLVKYNQEFIAYKKSRMYGTDVITLINKAIDANERLEATPDDEYFIDIAFTLTEDVSDVVTTYTWVKRNNTYTSKTEKNSSSDYKFKAEKTYSLSANKKEIDKLLEGKDIANGVKNFINDKDYTITYTGFQDFKRMIFECTGVEYNKNSGKINKMTFKQVKSSTY